MDSEIKVEEDSPTEVKGANKKELGMKTQRNSISIQGTTSRTISSFVSPRDKPKF